MDLKSFANGNVYIQYTPPLGGEYPRGALDNYHLIVAGNIVDAQRPGPCPCVQCLVLKTTDFEKNVKWDYGSDPHVGTLSAESLR